jgi:hypothetical protein
MDFICLPFIPKSYPSLFYPCHPWLDFFLLIRDSHFATK